MGPVVRVRGLKFRVYCLAFQVEGLEGEQVADEGARALLPGWFSFTRNPGTYSTAHAWLSDAPSTQ